MNATKEKWDAHYLKLDRYDSSPNHLLTEHEYLLPSGGVALEIACGLGANIIHLAKRGFDCHAWDISVVALEKLKQQATHLNIKTEQCDVTQKQFPDDYFDIVIVNLFLERTLIPSILQGTKKSGLVFYQTFTQNTKHGPRNPSYLLEKNELLRLFQSWDILFYREYGFGNKVQSDTRDQAMLIAQKP